MTRLSVFVHSETPPAYVDPLPAAVADARGTGDLRQPDSSHNAAPERHEAPYLPSYIEAPPCYSTPDGRTVAALPDGETWWSGSPRRFSSWLRGRVGGAS